MEKRELNIKDSAIALIISFVACQLMVLLGQILISVTLSFFDYNTSKITNFLNSPTGCLLASLFQFFAFIGVFIYYLKKTNLKKVCFANKLNLLQTLIFIALDLITMFALNHFISYFCLTLNLFNKPTATFSYELNDAKAYIISLISLAVLPAIGEELLFRGIIFNGLKQKGTLFAVIVSSLFFSLFHFNLSQLFYPFFFVLLLGFVYSKTKNITVTILIHFINNAVNLSIQYFSKSNLFKPSIINLILMIIGAIVFIAILAYLFITSYKQQKQINTFTEENNNQINKSNTSQTKKVLVTTNDKIVFWAPIIFMIFMYIIIV